MLPGPCAGAFGGFGDGAVLRHHCVDQRYIAVVRFGLLVHQAQNTARTGQTHHDGVDLLGKAVHVAGELLGHVQEGNDDADGERHAGNAHVGCARQQEHAAHESYKSIEHIADVGNDRPQHIGIGVGTEAILKEGVVDPVKVLLALLFVAENLDHLLAVHHLLNKAFGAAHGLLLTDEESGRAAADLAGNKNHHHNAHQQYQRHPDAEIQHDAHDAGNDCSGLNDGGQGLGNKLAQGVDIIGVVAHDIAVLVGIEILDGQILHTVEHAAAHLAQKALSNHGHQLGMQHHGHNGKAVHTAQHKHLGYNFLAGSRPVAALLPVFDSRNHLLHEDGRQCGGGCRNQDADNGDRYQNGIEFEKHLQNPLQHAEINLAAAGHGAFAAGHGAALHGTLIHRLHLRSSAAHRLHGRSRWTASARHECPSGQCGHSPSRGSYPLPSRRQHAGQ